MYKGKDHIREELIQELLRNRIFWSYKRPKPESIHDDILIEKTLIYLDIEDINKLFYLYPESLIKKIWNEKVVILDAQYRSMNLLLASLYFNVKNPQNYLNRHLDKHYKKLQLS
ncbi:MAG: hypothetical protein K8R35_04845 [Bacteroidales bacterium]|nr:hypothetical protein [Bacteroidales bacterium]